jgi:hypothetical protein
MDTTAASSWWQAKALVSRHLGADQRPIATTRGARGRAGLQAFVPAVKGNADTTAFTIAGAATTRRFPSQHGTAPPLRALAVVAACATGASPRRSFARAEPRARIATDALPVLTDTTVKGERGETVSSLAALLTDRVTGADVRLVRRTGTRALLAGPSSGAVAVVTADQVRETRPTTGALPIRAGDTWTEGIPMLEVRLLFLLAGFDRLPSVAQGDLLLFLGSCRLHWPHADGSGTGENRAKNMPTGSKSRQSTREGVKTSAVHGTILSTRIQPARLDPMPSGIGCR